MRRGREGRIPVVLLFFAGLIGFAGGFVAAALEKGKDPLKEAQGFANESINRVSEAVQKKGNGQNDGARSAVITEDTVRSVIEYLASLSDAKRVQEPPLYLKFALDKLADGPVGKVASEDEKKVHIETPTGEKLTIDKMLLKDRIKLSRDQIHAYLKKLLVEMCGIRQIQFEEPSSYAFTDYLDPMYVFEVFEFSIRNGLNEQVFPLITAALTKQPDLARLISEERAYDYSQQFLQALERKDRVAAKKYYYILLNKYSQTMAFKTYVQTEINALSELDKEIAVEIMKETAKAPVEKQPEMPKPVAVQDEKPIVRTDGKNEPKTNNDEPPPNPDLANANKLVEEGKQNYEKALAIVNRTASNAELKNALKLLFRARDCFEQAQDLIEKVTRSVPGSLSSSLKDTYSTIYLCRKKITR